ncbi:ABC transporter ATP-binding protein [Sorangium sp. So ce124]|uniref:ABC transporter ATP-binding protein n=1 Tax=Sorangium sp. So ce124 TaxID=3133280 RepID=UPI003F5FDE54
MKRSLIRDLRRSLNYLSPHRGRLSVCLALTLVSGGLPALEPLAHRAIFDQISASAGVFGPGSGPAAPGELGARALAGMTLALCALVVLRQIAEGLGALSVWRVRLRINRDLLDETTARLHALPLSYHQERGVGETMTRVDRGITSLMDCLSSVAFQLFPALVYLVVSLGIMLRLSPLLALVAVGFIVPPLLLGRATTARLVEREREVLDRWCGIYNRFQQVLSGIKTVKAFAREADEHARFIGSVEEAQSEVLRSIGLQTRLSAGRSVCVNIGRVVLLGVGGLLVLRGELGVGTLVAFLGYVGGLYGPAQTLLGVYETARRAEVGLAAIFGVLDAEVAVADPERAVSPEHIRGDLELDQVSFRYQRAAGRAVIDGISLSIRAGEFVAVVGPSGAGKSTLADLLLRLHDPTSGAIRIDGHDLRALSQRALRRKLGIVTQEPFLFEDTIEANLRYGSPDATKEALRAAARAACADEFIERLPLGYQTLVGRGGVALSGGERQRLAIARTLLKDPSVVILDEPTSSLDIASETAVQRAIEGLSRGRTTLLIAHRLSTTTRADRVVVIDGGRVVEQGPPAALLRRGGAYRRMMDLWRAHEPSGARGLGRRAGGLELLEAAAVPGA